MLLRCSYVYEFVFSLLVFLFADYKKRGSLRGDEKEVANLT